MKKIKKKIPVYIEQMEEKEFFVTSDGVEFEFEEDAIKHENLKNLKVINLGNILPNISQQITLVQFENQTQVEFYERKQCGNDDDVVYGSWSSCPEKFSSFPTWVACYYEIDYYSNEFSAKYYTLDEFKQILKELNDIVEDLS